MKKIKFKDYVYRNEAYNLSAITKYIARIESQSETRPNDPCTAVIGSYKIYERATELALFNIPACEMRLAEKAVTKWNVGNGGVVSSSDFHAAADAYFDPIGVVDDDVARYVRETFFLIMNAEESIGAVCKSASKLYAIVMHSFKKKSSGSTIYEGDRREEPCVKLSFKLAFTQPYAYDLIEAMYRVRDGKIRLIFNSPLSNYVREARVFAALFEWWTSHAVDHHYSNDEAAANIIILKGKANYTGDYKGMDLHFIEKAVHLTVDMACDCIHCSMNERSQMHQVVQAMFDADVLVGDEVYVGEKAFLSGLYPTHPMECMFNYAILASAARMLGYTVVTVFRPLKHGECFISVNGDDSYVIFGDALTNSQLHMFAVTHAYVASKVGQIVELSKVGYGRGTFEFCKHEWAMSLNTDSYRRGTLPDGRVFPIPKYCLRKAVHTLYRPENMPPLYWTTMQYLVWFCSVMDDAKGTQNFESVVSYIALNIKNLGKHSVKEAVYDMNIVAQYQQLISLAVQHPNVLHTSEAQQFLVNAMPHIEAYKKTINMLNEDFWFREYSNWELSTSATFQILLKLFR